jgi:RHS repeat-associated protein
VPATTRRSGDGPADPVAGASTSSYDPAGNLTETVDSAGRATSYAYDAINRKTDQWATTLANRSDTLRTGHWDYDDPALPYAVGHLTKTTTYVGGTSGAAYVTATAATGYDVFGNSLGEDVTIPATEDALAGTYSYNHTYSAVNGLIKTDTYPAVAGLPAETLGHTYLAPLDTPYALTGLQFATAYDAYGRIQQSTLGVGNNKTYVTRVYNDHTDRLTKRTVGGGNSATPIDSIESHGYTYDVAGNLTSETEHRNGNTTTGETRCYQYDNLARLTAAWTGTDDCSTTPTDANHATIGDTLDPAGTYRTTWTFDAIGRRQNETQHSTGAGIAQASTAYHYDSTDQKPTLTSATTTTTSADASSTTTSATGYTYDSTGNLHTRTGTPAGDQTLTWDNNGHLGQVSSTTKGSGTYTYTADGQLVSQHDPDKWTLYLPDGQLTLTTATKTISGIRYYELPGGDTAHRTGSGSAYGFDIADTHGTVELTLDNTAQIPTWRAFTPYGETRGTPTNWYDNRTFLTKPADDTTGLVNVGARFYDPAIGSFISLDPVLNPGDPQSLGGYAYADDNPTTNSDPTGNICRPGLDGLEGWCNGYGGNKGSTGGSGSSGGQSGGHCTYVEGPICGHGSTSPNWHFNKWHLLRYDAPQKTPPMSREEQKRGELGASPCEWYGRGSRPCPRVHIRRAVAAFALGARSAGGSGVARSRLAGWRTLMATGS